MNNLQVKKPIVYKKTKIATGKKITLIVTSCIVTKLMKSHGLPSNKEKLKIAAYALAQNSTRHG